MMKDNQCRQCQIGHLKPVTAPYLQRIDGQMMAVANMEAHRCDVCGYLEYDAVQVGRLQYLINHPAPEYRVKRWQPKRPLSSDLPAALPSR